MGPDGFEIAEHKRRDEIVKYSDLVLELAGKHAAEISAAVAARVPNPELAYSVEARVQLLMFRRFFTMSSLVAEQALTKEGK